MGCDSIATTISGMGKEPTTLGPEDLKGHRFSAFWLRSSFGSAGREVSIVSRNFLSPSLFDFLDDLFSLLIETDSGIYLVLGFKFFLMFGGIHVGLFGTP